MSTFRRSAWIRWLPPMERPSPSPVTSHTWRSGRAIRNPVANVITEVIGTFVLVLGILAFFNNEATAATGLGPLIVGLLVLGIGLSLGGPTGYAINPARDLGPRLAHAVLPIPGKGGSDWSYAWIPIIAPTIGGVLGGLVYHWFWG